MPFKLGVSDKVAPQNCGLDIAITNFNTVHNARSEISTMLQL